MPNICSPAVPDVQNAATVNDFVLATTMTEAVELSNLDSGGNTIDCERLNKALKDAYSYITSKALLADSIGKQIVELNLNRWMIMVARYYLDTIRRRPDVEEDYKLVELELNKLAETSTTGNSYSDTKILHSTNKVPVFTQKSLSHYTDPRFGVL